MKEAKRKNLLTISVNYEIFWKKAKLWRQLKYPWLLGVVCWGRKIRLHHIWDVQHQKWTNVDHGLRIITMCQHRFTNCNKYTTLVGNTDDGEGYVLWWGRGTCEISIPSSQVFWELKTTPKNLKIWLKNHSMQFTLLGE